MGSLPTDSSSFSIDFETDLLVVTCASGKQGTALVPNVVHKWRHLRLVCQSESSQQRLQQEYPNAEVIRADMQLAGEPERILKGASTVYHVEPPFAHRQAVIGFRMIDAAKKSATEGTFKHFVYGSVMNAQLSKMLHHDSRREVEEYLLESGLNYTILQPAHFMFLFPIAPLISQDRPVYEANWNPAVNFSFLALIDLGEVAAKVINERERHYAALYPLCSDGPTNYNEICNIVSEKIGKKIEVRQKGFEEAVHGFSLRIFGTPKPDSESLDAAERLLLYYNRHGLLGNSNVCEWLLGRKPTSWEDFATAEVNAVTSR